MPFLSFEDAGMFKDRKWQCFCCAKNFEEYEAYSTHIKDEHEQGREWLECPDCNAPVRDLKTHYKAKHPKRVLPADLQTRVVVWRDFKPGGKNKGKGSVRKPNARKGSFTSNKCGRDFEYKSGLEEEFFNLLEQDVDVANWIYEPFKIPYFWKGEWHNYIPDLRINFIDATTQIWEIKPMNQTEYEQNKAKWAAANNYCANMGWEFIVQTNEIVDTYRWKIQRQINEAKRHCEQELAEASALLQEILGRAVISGRSFIHFLMCSSTLASMSLGHFLCTS
jgi:hypothetical protein